jgi:hypothetical protein
MKFPEQAPGIPARLVMFHLIQRLFRGTGLRTRELLPHGSGDPFHSPAQPGADESTGLPGLPTWRRVYLFVFGCFVLWVVLLVVFSRVFA